METSQVIIRGRVERKEFREPFRQCTEMLESIGVPFQVNPADTSEPVDFALFFQSYPHEFLRSEWEQLRQNHPFAPFFFVLGTCCEGMLRTAGALDSPFYCYVHGWSGEETEQIRLFLTDQSSVFSLPLTAENDEIALWMNPNGAAIFRLRNTAQSKDCGSAPPKCLILTHFGPFGNDSAMNRLLADEHERLGYAPIFSGTMQESGGCQPPDLPPDIKIVADADDSPREKILESIQRLRSQFADNEFTVYVDSPRIDEKNDYLQAGATCVLAKIR
jgi:hypothetical protein